MIGLTERGWLRTGMIADITIFDPRTIADRATIADPVAPSVGVRAVLINGRVVWRNGSFYPGAGAVLRRSRHEPSRVMQPNGNNRLSGALRMEGGIQARIEAAMAGKALPTGQALVTGLQGGGSFVIDEPGLLQTAPGWAALTGIGHGADGRRLAATLIVESADAQRGQGRLVLIVGGRTIVDAAIDDETPVNIDRFSNHVG